MMKNSSQIIFLALTILVVVASLFSQVTTSFAQEDYGWTSPVNLSLSGLATNPSLVIDARGTLHAVWLEDARQYKYSRSEDDGVTWATPQAVQFPFGEKDSRPILLAGGSGSIHLFWISSLGVLFHGRTSPQYFTTPSKWESNRRIASDVLKYEVIEDAQGRLHLAYVHNVSTAANPAGVYYMRSGVGGSTWADPISLYESEYFRSTTESETSVRIAAAQDSTVERVFVTWDSRPQKRVFMAISENGGVDWNSPQQIKGPEDTGGIDAPFNLTVAAVGNKILLLWQQGEPGSEQCTIVSEWSENAGESWSVLIPVLSGHTECPTSSRFILQREDYIVVMMTGQGTPIIAAWNGETWSEPQNQAQLLSFSNPQTYDAVFLGCRFDLVQEGRLYVIGCDQGGGGDIWFISRSLDPVEDWFAPSNVWSVPVNLTGRAESFVASTSDINGFLHSIWMSTSISDNGNPVFSLEYARWNDEKWIRSEPVISGAGEPPLYFSLSVHAQERLLLTWVDSSSGDLLFSWVNLNRANVATEWARPVTLPSPSNLLASPDMVVDGAGQVVVVYAVPLNEARGIYVVQSTDSKNWSSPVAVFDAAAAGWEQVGDPHISLSQDGVLHLIFSRSSMRTGHPVGLYYSQSVDGGATWSESQILSEAQILWSDVVSYDDDTVHVVWQEYDGLVYSNLSKVSEDGGLTWGKSLNLTGVNDNSTPLALATDGLGTLHVMQLLKNEDASTVHQESLILQDWKWNGSNWDFASERNVVVKGHAEGYFVSAGITPERFLVVSISAEYLNSENKYQLETQTVSRYLGKSHPGSGPTITLLPTSVIGSESLGLPAIVPTQPVDLTVLQDDNASTTPKNIVGIVLIGILITTFLLLRTRSGAVKK